MLNRNDKRALRRNRSAVSWLCILVIILSVWLRNLYSDIDYARFERDGAFYDLNESEMELNKSRKKIDSLYKVINYKDTIPVVKKVQKSSTKKDTISYKSDTTLKSLKKENIILKDSTSM